MLKGEIKKKNINLKNFPKKKNNNKKIRIKYDRKKNRRTVKSQKDLYFKTIPNKINNNKKNENPIWYMKKIEEDEIEK